MQQFDWNGGMYQLFHGDCVKGMQKMDEASVDVIVTSPPYNLGIRYGKYDDSVQREEYLEWSTQWAKAARRVLNETGSLFLNVGACPASPLLPHELAIIFSKELILQNTFHWVKSITVSPREGGLVSAGHFKPINSQRFVTDCHEYVFHFTHKGDVKLDRLAIGVPYADKSNIARWGHTGGRDKRCRGNVWFIPYKTIQSRSKDRPHPATFPSEVAEFCIKLHGGPEKLHVMDPFVGIGHAALAAQALEVPRFTGFDIDDHYLTVAMEGLQAIEAQTA